MNLSYGSYVHDLDHISIDVCVSQKTEVLLTGWWGIVGCGWSRQCENGSPSYSLDRWSVLLICSSFLCRLTSDYRVCFSSCEFPSHTACPDDIFLHGVAAHVLMLMFRAIWSFLQTFLQIRCPRTGSLRWRSQGTRNHGQRPIAARGVRCKGSESVSCPMTVFSSDWLGLRTLAICLEEAIHEVLKFCWVGGDCCIISEERLLTCIHISSGLLTLHGVLTSRRVCHLTWLGGGCLLWWVEGRVSVGPRWIYRTVSA